MKILKICLLATLTLASCVAEAADTTNAAVAKASAPQMFDVQSYTVEGNTVLPQSKIDSVLTNRLGKIDLAQLREGLGELQMLYRNLGFVTVSVSLPQQRLTNGVVKVKVIEGKLSNIVVTGNHYYTSNNIRAALPSLDTNIFLNTKWFQTELDRANTSQDRQIYPVIGPGLEPGTSELTLKVKDRLPLHGHIEVNDKSTAHTPLLRVDAALQYNNLWQLDHQAGIDYNFSPQKYKSSDNVPELYNAPEVVSYSGFYRIPLRFGNSLREDYDRYPVDFGYDQVTHQFRLPPPTGNPELTFFGSRSISETPLRLGPITTIVTNTLIDIKSQFADHSFTFNDDIGTKLTLPTRDFAGIQSSFQFGFEGKTFESRVFNTNITYAKIYQLDSSGNRILQGSTNVYLAANSLVSLYYLPLSLGWNGSRRDETGVTSVNVGEYIFLEPFASSQKGFVTSSGAPEAGGNYTTVNAGLTREQQLPRDWSILFRANGQWASAPVIGNEQFALGGTGGVRGYPEGETYGDTGWRGLFDLRLPAYKIGTLPGLHEEIPGNLRCSAFMDYGQAYHLTKNSGPIVRQWGSGVSAYLTAGEHWDARLTLAWALHNTPTTRAGAAQGYFTVGYQF